MAQDGLGIACLPAAMLTQSLEAGKLQKLDYASTPNDLRFEARYLLDLAPTFIREAAAIALRLLLPKDNI